MGGGINPCLILWRGARPSLHSPPNGDPVSTQILTQHCGAKPQTVSQLTNSRTAPTRQVLVVQPLWVIETPEEGVDVQAAAFSDNPDGAVRIH
jgi:hypothetical protein